MKITNSINEVSGRAGRVRLPFQLSFLIVVIT